MSIRGAWLIASELWVESKGAESYACVCENKCTPHHRVG